MSDGRCPNACSTYPYTTLFRSSRVYRLQDLVGGEVRRRGRDQRPLGSGLLVAPAEHLGRPLAPGRQRPAPRSEEHTSELQSRGHLVCRLLLEKKQPTLALTKEM